MRKFLDRVHVCAKFHFMKIKMGPDFDLAWNDSTIEICVHVIDNSNNEIRGGGMWAWMRND